MKIYEVKDRTQIMNTLLKIWEASVRETHLIITENEVGKPVAFMGTEKERLEMLFLSPEERGRGTGKKLIQYGIQNYGIREVTVNEQNPQAVGFYEHMGFETYKRTEFDEEGNPYPLLYMKLTENRK